MGEILSFAIYAYLLFSLITSDAFTKKNPNVLEKEVDNELTFWYNFTEENFVFGAIIADNYGRSYELDPSIGMIYTSYNAYGSGGEDIENTFINMPYCRDTYVMLAFPQLVAEYPNSFCLPNPRFQIGGYYNEPITMSLEIVLNMCDNATSNNSCKPQSDIDAFFTNKRFGFSMSNNMFSTDNYEDPITSKMYSTYFNIDPKIRKIYTSTIQKVIIADDDELILSNPNATLRESWTLGDEQNDFDSNSDINLMQIIFYSSTKETLINRTYMKFQEALGSLGGMANVFISLGFLFLPLFSPYGGIDFFLSNYLFSFRNLGNKDKNDDVNVMNKFLEKQDSSPYFERRKTEEHVIKFLPSDVCKINQNIELTNVNLLTKNNPTIIITFTPNPETNELMSGTRVAQVKGDEELVYSENQIEEVHHKKIFAENSENIQKNFIKKMTINDTAEHQNHEKGSRRTSRSKSMTRSRMSRKSMSQEDKKMVEQFQSYSKQNDKKNALKINLTELFKGAGRKNFLKKIRALKIAKTKINKDLDIINLMQKFQEIDKLKLLLLNRKQLMLFDLIAKPEILLDDEGKTQIEPGAIITECLKKIQDKSDKDLVDLAIYYHEIKNKEKCDDLEGRLFQLLDGDMKQYFDV